MDQASPCFPFQYQGSWQDTLQPNGDFENQNVLRCSSESTPDTHKPRCLIISPNSPGNHPGTEYPKPCLKAAPNYPRPSRTDQIYSFQLSKKEKSGLLPPPKKEPQIWGPSPKPPLQKTKNNYQNLWNPQDTPQNTPFFEPTKPRQISRNPSQTRIPLADFARAPRRPPPTRRCRRRRRSPPAAAAPAAWRCRRRGVEGGKWRICKRIWKHHARAMCIQGGGGGRRAEDGIIYIYIYRNCYICIYRDLHTYIYIYIYTPGPQKIPSACCILIPVAAGLKKKPSLKLVKWSPFDTSASPNDLASPASAAPAPWPSQSPRSRHRPPRCRVWARGRHGTAEVGQFPLEGSSHHLSHFGK